MDLLLLLLPGQLLPQLTLLATQLHHLISDAGDSLILADAFISVLVVVREIHLRVLSRC